MCVREKGLCVRAVGPRVFERERQGKSERKEASETQGNHARRAHTQEDPAEGGVSTRKKQHPAEGDVCRSRVAV